MEIAEGITSTGIRLRDEIWALDLEPTVWTQLEPLPEPLAGHSCTADSASGVIVVWTGDGVLLVDPFTGESLPG